VKQITASVGCLLLVTLTRASTALRYFYSYADQRTVDFAIQSGGDPFAALGREIPQSGLFRVPSANVNEGVFKVGYCAEVVTSEARVIAETLDTNLVFDRTLCNNGSVNPALNGSSFRKVSYAYSGIGVYPIELKYSFSNFASVPLFNFTTGLPTDLNHDGIQDIGALQTAGPSVVRAAWRTQDFPSSISPVGIGAWISNVDPGGQVYHLHDGDKFRFCDVAFRSSMGAGESYGTVGQETGLQIFCGGEVGNGNSTYLQALNQPLRINIGARYNLLAVPEPTGLIALGIGVGLLRRRRSGSD
jgi:hypothetical protein